MKILIMMCGIPASGKSTVARNLQKSIGNTPIVSMDDIRVYLFGTRKCQKQGELVYSLSISKTIRLLQKQDVVIYDATNRTKEKRKEIAEYIQERVKCIIYCVYMATPFDTAIERNKNRDKNIQVPGKVIHRMFCTLEPPTKEEKYFEKIYVIEPKVFDNNKDMWYNMFVNQIKGDLKI